MVKSLLTIDYQGRVIRLDTFSKTLAPGTRIGWFVANKMFTERLLRGTEVQTQMVSGFSSVSTPSWMLLTTTQVIVGELLARWGVEGYLEWVTNLREQYRVRRDRMLGALDAAFDLVPAAEAGVPGAMGLVAYPKGQARVGPALLSFVPPVGGMFIWARVHYASHPGYATFAVGKERPEREFEAAFWRKLVDARVLVTPGWYFSPLEGEGVTPAANGAPGGAEGLGAFRLAYSYENKELMEEGIRRLAGVLVREWTQSQPQ
jgi:aromatic amino acid aminotransferase I